LFNVYGARVDRLHPVPRRRWIVLLAVVALVGTAVGTLVLVAPAVAATVCPRCYGLSDLGDGVYAEREDDGYRRMLDEADHRIAAFYGARTSRPRVLICATARCYARIGGGGEKGQAIRDWALMLSPGGANETIAAHELSHVEFHERLGSARAKVPHWFDEGLAVLVSDDPRYLKPLPEADRCRVPHEQAASVVGADWRTVSPPGGDLGYTLAACVVSGWVSAHGGPAAVLDLITRLRAGEDFTAIVAVPR
jgi:hypothetical protein